MSSAETNSGSTSVAPDASSAPNASSVLSASKTYVLEVKGMQCASCVAHVESALNKLPEVEDAKVSLKLQEARVIATKPFARQWVDAVNQAGFTASIKEGQSATSKAKASAKQCKSGNSGAIKLIMAALATAYLLAGDYVPAINIGYWGQLPLALAIQIVLGGPFYAGMFRALKAKSLLHKSNMDTLIALGSTAAFIAFMCGQPDQHYADEPLATHSHFHAHTSAMILLFIAFGRFLERRSLSEAGRVIDSLIAMTPQTATKVHQPRSGAGTGGTGLGGGISLSVLSSPPPPVKSETETIPVEQIVAGDIIRFVEGDRLIIDGEVAKGVASLDTSSLTGESLPISVKENDQVTSGSLVLEGMIEVKVVKAGQDTALCSLIELMKSAAFSKAPVQRLADSVAGIFVPVILLLTVATLLFWGLSGNWGEGIFASVAVMVVACPCALGLAVPTTLTVASGLAAGSGFLIRDQKILEIAGQASDIFFDKTGTLTQGDLNVQDIDWIVTEDQIAKSDTVSVLSAMTKQSQHPVSLALQQYLTEGHLNIEKETQLDHFESVPGSGLSASHQGATYRLGSANWLNLETEQSLNLATNLATEHEAESLSMTVHLMRDETHVLSVSMKDQLRDDAKETIQSLVQQGKKVHLISGDRKEAVLQVAEDLALDRTCIHAETMPADKMKRVKAAGIKGVMVGDGINDSGALMAAGIGVAMGRGSDLAMQAGDVIVTSNKLSAIPALLTLSKWTRRHIYSGLFWALIYNVILIPIAAAGKMPPAWAAAAMGLSSVCVVLNALLLRVTFKSLSN